MTPSTNEWVVKAEGDFETVVVLRRSRKRSRYDAICFHYQQCVEKYLKARLNEARISFSKTHDLRVLTQLLTPVEPLWTAWDPQLKSLTDFAVATRYPGLMAGVADARAAYAICLRVRATARNSLGLRA